MITLKLIPVFDRRPAHCHIKATGSGVEVSIYPNGSCWFPVSANLPKEIIDQVHAIAGNFWLFFENLQPEKP